MSVTINTRIVNVDVYPSHTDGLGNTESNVIYKVYWYIECEDSLGNSTIVSGDTLLDTTDLSTFSEFSAVTESQVKGWVVDVWGGTDSAGHLAKLQEAEDALTECLNPTSVNLELEG